MKVELKFVIMHEDKGPLDSRFVTDELSKLHDKYPDVHFNVTTCNGTAMIIRGTDES